MPIMSSGYFAKGSVLKVLMNGRQHISSVQQSYQFDFQSQFSSEVQTDWVKTKSQATAFTLTSHRTQFKL